MSPPRVTLKRGRARPLWHGHPWVFSEAIESVEGNPVAGDEVEVASDQGKRIGAGFISPSSQIRVRMLTLGDVAADDALLVRRIGEALALRRRLGLPGGAEGRRTSGYRLINSEGDYLPGLVVDVYDRVLVVSYTTVGMKRRESLITRALADALAPLAIIESPVPSKVSALEGFTSKAGVILGTLPEVVRVEEHGIKLEVSPLEAQKTGLFLDQRQNRDRLGELMGLWTSGGAAPPRVLDLFSYVGGFALACARAGAQVVAVDSSELACDRARKHAELNALSDRIAVLAADVFRFLDGSDPDPRGRESYDLVIVDPPKFAHRAKDLENALSGYHRLNALAMQRVTPGGFLATASCSGLVGDDDFERTLVQSAKTANRRLQLLERHGAGPDHPVPIGFAEGRYLKFYLCQVL